MIRLEDVSRVFNHRHGELVVFDKLNVSFETGRITAIVGPSGCGKTTLLRMIAGLDAPTRGSISYDTPNQRVGMVFQEYTAFPWLTVEGNVRFGLREKGLSTGEQHQALEYWLSKTELLEFRSYYPAQLSGGMKQRLALARTLGVEPAILLMDEPFGSLDALTRERIGSFCHKLLRSLELTVLLVTHSIREALLFADHIVVLSGAPAYCKLAVDLHPKASDILDVVESQMSTEIEKRVREALQ